MRFIFSFLFGLVSLFAYSQFQVSGKVVNKFNEPMENIHVHTHGKTTSTDVNGIYTIYNLKEGNHVIEFSFSGYLSFKQKYFLKSNLIINAVMIINETQIEEVAIQSKNSNVTKSQKENVISKSTIERYGSQNLGDVLKEIAGVSALKTGNSIVKPIINGLHSNRVVTLNHGIRIEDQQWGIEHAPNIDINSIQWAAH